MNDLAVKNNAEEDDDESEWSTEDDDESEWSTEDESDLKTNLSPRMKKLAVKDKRAKVDDESEWSPKDKFDWVKPPAATVQDADETEEDDNKEDNVKQPAAAPVDSRCIKCNKTGTALKLCSRCRSAKYCGAECQKADWTQHKKTCFKPMDVADPDKFLFHAINQNKFLHNRTELKTFHLLIDCLRMRQEDEYSLAGELMTGTIYNQECTSAPAFKQFLHKAKSVPGLLPPWWTDAKAKECVAYELKKGHDWGLNAAREKSDIQEEWKDSYMPMKLRMIAEKV